MHAQKRALLNGFIASLITISISLISFAVYLITLTILPSLSLTISSSVGKYFRHIRRQGYIGMCIVVHYHPSQNDILLRGYRQED